MKTPLQVKVSVFIALIIAVSSLVPTFFFNSALNKNLDRELIARGETLGYSLSRAAVEGISTENLDLIRSAGFIVQAEGVELSQVFSTVWNAIDAYPFERLSEHPHPDALNHFKTSNAPFLIRTDKHYEFYNPVIYRPDNTSAELLFGYTRISLSSGNIRKAAGNVIAVNILISVLITIIAVFAVNYIINRFVLKPIVSLHNSMRKLKDGLPPDTLPVSPQGEIGELIEKFTEMSAAVRDKEEKLVASQQKLTSLFDRVGHAIFTTDNNCNIIRTNKRFEEMFGKYPANICDISSSGIEALNYVRQGSPGAIINKEEKVININGAELLIMISLYPEMEQTGSFSGFDGYIIDITEKKRLEEELLQSQKMEAIGTLAGGIAHDFNNMLQIILGYASFLKLNLSENDPMYPPIISIERSANRAADLTKQLLGFARGGKYIVSSVNLNEVVNTIIRIVSRTFDKAIEIKTDLWPGLRLIEADQSQLEQVLMNLCINARDAMPGGGVLKIDTFNFEGRPVHEAGPGKWSVVRITDTGAGIDRNIINRIFEPFFTTKETGKGTGIGLAMVYGVIKNHGGHITVESETGKGSVFTIYLPAAEKQKEAVTVESKSIDYGKGLILVVDDEEIVRDICRTILETTGYDVIEAPDGIAAVELYSQKKDSIVAVILDMVMPKMNGKETFLKLKEINPEVRVLLSSGFTIDETAREILGAGAGGFIQKPYNISKFSKALSELLARS